MIKTKKKWLAMMMAVVMMVGSLGVGFAITIEPGVDTFRDFFSYLNEKYFDRLTAADQTTSLFALNAVKAKKVTLANEIKNNLSDESKAYLTQYGFTSTKIDELIEWSIPKAEEIVAYLSTIAINNEKDIDNKYEDYEAYIHTLESEFWALLPIEFKDHVNEFAPTAEERILLAHTFIKAFVDTGSRIGVATGINTNDFKLTLDANDSMIKITEIRSSIKNAHDFDFPMDMINTAVDSTNKILKVLESDFTTNQSVIDLLIKFNFVNMVPYVAPPIGGGGFPIIPPVVPPTEPGNPETPVGTPNPDVIYTSLAMREATQLINSPSVTPAQVTPVLEVLAKEVLSGSQDIVETQQIVERAVALFEKLLENPALTNADAIAMAEMVLSQFVAPAMVKDTIGATDPALKVIAADLMTELLEKVGTIPSSGVITLAMAQTAAKAQDDALETMKDTLNAIFSSLEQSRLTQNLMITAPATSVRVEADGVAFMKANDLGLTVKSGSAMIILPTALVDGLTSSLSLMVDLSPKSSAGLGLKLQNGNASSAPVVYDISLYLINAQNEVAEVLTNIQPLVSLPIGNLTANLHTVGAYYYNETSQVWEYVRSTISGNRMVFLAPHLSTYGVLQRSMVFSDMMTHWAKNVVEELAVKNIISGRAPELYVPNGTITRAEFATLLVQTLQLEGDIKVTFADVDIKDWYYQYVNVAALHGLVSGVGDGKFNPNANITRQDMAIMIVKAYEKMLGTPVKSVAVDIKDLSDVSQYAKDRVLAARFNRLIGGYPDGTFKPLANATRAEAAQMIRNLLEK
jgi:hypothetical protein